MAGLTSCEPINKQCAQLKSNLKSFGATSRGQEVCTSHNFYSAPVTAIRPPRLAILQKGTSSLSTCHPETTTPISSEIPLSVVGGARGIQGRKKETMGRNVSCLCVWLIRLAGNVCGSITSTHLVMRPKVKFPKEQVI